MPDLNELLHVAMDAAYAGGRRALAYFNTRLAVERKRDDTPVTCADRETETLIRSMVAGRYPAHSIIGEEHGRTHGSDEYRWIIDPIDGTKSFICGVPLWGVLIGVEVRGVASVGVVYLPGTDEMIAAAAGGGCTWNGRPARVSGVSSLADATMTTTSPMSCIARSDAFEHLARQVRIVRGWGDCYGHVLVATGRADIMIDYAANPWDVAPLLPILTEAGGHFTTWRGEATIWGADGVSTNAALHEPVIEILKSEKRRV
jgi:histidinol phosphatase-like enzyme (inositol monophosphatase family)